MNATPVEMVVVVTLLCLLFIREFIRVTDLRPPRAARQTLYVIIAVLLVAFFFLIVDRIVGVRTL